MNTSRLIAKAHVPQSEAAVLKVGNPAELKVPELDEPIKAASAWLAPLSILVAPRLKSGSSRQVGPALRPGMSLEVSMTAKTVKDAIVVPLPLCSKR